MTGFLSQKYAKNCGSEALRLQILSCGLQKNCDCRVAVAEQHFFKSCGIAIVEVPPSSCGIAIADSKKSCVCPPLLRRLRVGQFFGKETKRSPMVPRFLLHDATDMSAVGVSGKRKFSMWGGMLEGYCRGQEVFCILESTLC
jgi:hypothetical protein